MAKTTNYVSDTTKFINTFLTEHPQVVEKQQLLRSTWWDTDGVDYAQQEEYSTSKVKLEEYAYFSYPKQK